MKAAGVYMEQSNNRKIIAGAIVIAAVVLIALAASILGKKEETTSQSNTSETAQNMSTDSSRAPDPAISYKDGTYVVFDTYSSPGGIEDIKVTLTLNSNVISDVKVEQEANNEESAGYQQKFQQSYKSKVVGKALSNLGLSRSSGASLTTNAFNDALEEIRAKAKA